MSLFRGYFVPVRVDPTGLDIRGIEAPPLPPIPERGVQVCPTKVEPCRKNMEKTGVQICNTGGLINHAYIKACGKGYGFYAASHLHSATCVDDILTMFIVSGKVIDYDHLSYPDAECSDVYVDTCCIDPDCYKSHVCAMAEWHHQNSEQGDFIPCIATIRIPCLRQLELPSWRFLLAV